jgi:hypothetical protein
MIVAAERPAELIDLQGAWRRNGRTFTQGSLSEVADVLWLQVGRYLCDLRTGNSQANGTHILDQSQAFSGSVLVQGGAISFHHDLDSLPRDPAHPDEGTVHRIRDVMYERGRGYEERWIMTSLPGDDVGVAELRAPGVGDSPLLARLVRVGVVALAVWGGATRGGAQFNQDHDWVRERTLNDCDTALKIDAAVVALAEGGPLPDGWVTIDPGEI